MFTKNYEAGMIRLDRPYALDDPEGRPGLYAGRCVRCERLNPHYRRAYGRDACGMAVWLREHIDRYHGE